MNPNYRIAGSLITYNSSKRSDITRINYLLFGRVVSIQKDGDTVKYYYPGLFENEPYKKVSNGCYFVKNLSTDSSLLRVYPATIMFADDNMQTARDYWKDKINGKIQNW
jgi:hypothetical protein